MNRKHRINSRLILTKNGREVHRYHFWYRTTLLAKLIGVANGRIDADGGYVYVNYGNGYYNDGNYKTIADLKRATLMFLEPDLIKTFQTA